MKKGLFLVFEGGEGSGKSTQAKLLTKYLISQNYAVLLTKEPGGGDEITQDIRKILLDPVYKELITGKTELFLFAADRIQHLAQTIKPALDKGEIVICDRFNASTFAYQCFARKIISEKDFFLIDDLVVGDIKPNFYFYIDIDPQMGLKRKDADGFKTRFEMENLEFHQKVREGYRHFFKKFVKKNQWQKFDGSQSVDEIHQQIRDCLNNFLKTKWSIY